METFLKQDGDEVDGALQKLIETSTEDDSSEESDEDVVFSLDKSTGFWQSGDGTQSHKGDRRGNYSLINTNNSRDFSRHFESSSEANLEAEPLISV